MNVNQVVCFLCENVFLELQFEFEKGTLFFGPSEYFDTQEGSLTLKVNKIGWP